MGSYIGRKRKTGSDLILKGKMENIILISTFIMILLLSFQIEKVNGIPLEGPDIEVTFIEFSNPDINNLRVNDKPKISIGITNRGTIEINQTWTIRITDNQQIVREEKITNPIAPGELYYYNISHYKLKKFERLFEVYVDYNNEINETNEENNVLTTVANVKHGTPFVDLFLLMIFIIIPINIACISYVIFKHIRKK